MSTSTAPIRLRATALVQWASDQGETCYLGAKPAEPSSKATINIDFRPAERSACIKLNATLLSGEPPKLTSTYLFMQAHNILNMEQINAEGTAVDSTPTAVRNAFVANKMCPSASQIRGLRFQLRRASALVVPTDFAVVQSNEVAANVFQSLSSLSTQTTFTVYYAHRSEPEASMATLCHLARIGRLKSTADEYSLERLYHGRGGTPYPFPERGGDHAADPIGVDSPPSYDEIGLSPPPAAESSKRARGSESPTPSAVKKPKPSGAARMNQFEQQLAAMGARIASLEQARGASADGPTRSAVEGLRADLEALVAERCDAGVRRLRAELVEEIDRRVEERVDELADERIDARLEELKDELAGEVDERVDDRLLDLKCDAQEFVREQLEDVEAQLKSKIAQAQVTIEFADEL